MINGLSNHDGIRGTTKPISSVVTEKKGLEVKNLDSETENTIFHVVIFCTMVYWGVFSGFHI